VGHQIQTRVNGTEKQTIRTANTTTVKDEIKSRGNRAKTHNLVRQHIQ